MNSQRKWLPYAMWLLPVIFFSYQFILRLWPGLMMPQIMENLSIDAGQFGVLASFYYWGYAGMQIPVALMLERYGVRNILFLFALICGLATFLFNLTDNYYLALVSRFLVGAGSAVGFLGISKAVSEWFSREAYSKMIGLSFTLGLLGAIYGGKPVGLLIETYSPTSVGYFLAVVSIVIAFSALYFYQTPRAIQKTTQNQFKLSELKNLLSSPKIWVLAIANLLLVGTLEGFADVWGVPYLMVSLDYAKSDAAGLVSFIFVGMLFGGPLLALLSKRLGEYFVISLCGLGMAAAFITLLINGAHTSVLLSLLFFFMGLLCCYQVIVFALGSKLVKDEQLGVTVAFLNAINMLGGSFFHTSIGYVMDRFWTGAFNTDGIRMYDVTGYQTSLIIIPVAAVMGTILILLLRQNLSRQQRLS